MPGTKQAFPEGRIGNTGMSMRQYYKAAALQGLLASMAHPNTEGSNLR